MSVKNLYYFYENALLLLLSNYYSIDFVRIEILPDQYIFIRLFAAKIII